MARLIGKQIFFTESLLAWHSNFNKRTMPWTKENDIYKIWISEIILQQTRVEQGLSYYINFIKSFPDIQTLALADDEGVFKVWEGLGYYSRCKNLLFTARKIYFELQGRFPEEYQQVLALKGIGPYTAAAICSFAYGLPHAVVDGNVYRVLARYFGEARPIDTIDGKRFFNELAHILLHKDDSASYNQAIMDFGATVCKPQIPVCGTCVLQSHCEAYKSGTVNKLPVKEKQLVKTNRFFTYFIFIVGGKALVNKREEKDIWQNLYEFYLYESAKPLHWKNEEIKAWLQEQLSIDTYNVLNVSQVYTQQLTHQSLQGRFITIQLKEVPPSLSHFAALSANEIKQVAFPKFINQYLEQNLDAVPLK